MCMNKNKLLHQWSGNPHFWDPIYQHQRKPQRLLVKLLTNILIKKTDSGVTEVRKAIQFKCSE